MRAMLDYVLRGVVLGLSFAAFGCAQIDVSTRAAPGADLSAYRSYAHAPPDEEQLRDRRLGEADMESVRTEVDRGLRGRGFVGTSSGEPDFRVRFLVNSTSEVRLVNAGDHDANAYAPRRFTNDTLIITLVDARTGQPVWTGTGVVETPRSGALIGSDRTDSLLRAVRAVLSELPQAR